MNNNRYCEGCKHLTKKTGYCNKAGTKMAAEKQSDEHVRCASCISEGWKEQGEDMANDSINKTLQFVVACIEVLKDKPTDIIADVTCPICGKIAKCSKSSYNGHRRGECECGMNFME